MGRPAATTVFVGALLLVAAVSGCLGPSDGPDGSAETSEPTTDADTTEGDQPIPTKAPPRVVVGLDDATAERYGERIDGRDLMVLDAQEPSVLHCTVDLFLAGVEAPVNVTLSWEIEGLDGYEVDAVGAYQMEAAPVVSNMTLPVVIVPDDDLVDAEATLRVNVSVDPPQGVSADVIGLLFR